MPNIHCTKLTSEIYCWILKFQRNHINRYLCNSLILKGRDIFYIIYAPRKEGCGWLLWPFLLTASVTGFNFNTWGTRQNGRHFADDNFKCIFLDKNVWILIKSSMKFVPKGPINNIPALVQIMAWRRPGWYVLLTHICVTLPQWVNPRDK